jgi:hypothetical protein
VVLFVALAQTTQDFDGFDTGLTYHHRLEATFESGIALDVLAILIEGGGSDTLQFTPGQGRLEMLAASMAPSAAPGPDQV